MEKHKSDILEICNRIYKKGWVANHDGNATIKLSADSILATPTAESKGYLTKEMLISVDLDGKKISGTKKIFSEINLHLACFKARSDIGAVLHAHPVMSTALGVSRQSLDSAIISEAIVSLGDKIPAVPYSFPGSTDGGNIIYDYVRKYNALLIPGNGVLTVGEDIYQAFYRMELVEHLASINFFSNLAGAKELIPTADIEKLLEKRKQAGLDPEANSTDVSFPSRIGVRDKLRWESSSENKIPICMGMTENSAAPKKDPDLRRMIEEELLRVLKK